MTNGSNPVDAGQVSLLSFKFPFGPIVQITSSLPIISSSSSNITCIIVLISVQYKASCLLLVLIPDPGILVCLLDQTREISSSIVFPI